MNKFYHYGDSFATCDLSETIFSNYISDYFGKELIMRASAGKNNEYILHYLLKDLPNFKKGDTIFIGFTFFERGSIVNSDNEMKSTNIYYNEITKDTHSLHPRSDIELEKKINRVNYHVEYTWDYYIRVFKYLLKPTLSYIKSKGVELRYFHLLKDEIKNGNTYNEYHNFLPDKEIIFDEGDFIKFLEKRNWMNEESVHYTWDIQEKLAMEFINRW